MKIIYYTIIYCIILCLVKQLSRKLKQFQSGSNDNYSQLLAMCIKLIGKEPINENHLSFKRIETHVLKHSKPLDNNCSIIVGEDNL